MLEKTNYEWNYKLESNVIDLAKAKKIIKNKNIKNKLKKDDNGVKKVKNNTGNKQVSKYKAHDILRSSIYKRILTLTLIFIFACGAIFVWFKFETSQNVFLIRFGTKCTGKVIDTEEEISLIERGDKIVYRSSIEFKTANGENVQFKTGVYRDFYKYNKGTITVVYNSNNPKMAKEDSFDTLIMPVIIFMAIGGAFLLFPIYLIYFDCVKKLKFLNERRVI
jgi:hypothetical protein